MKRTASVGKASEILPLAVICGHVSAPLYSLSYCLWFGAFEYTTFTLAAQRGRHVFSGPAFWDHFLINTLNHWTIRENCVLLLALSLPLRPPGYTGWGDKALKDCWGSPGGSTQFVQVGKMPMLLAILSLASPREFLGSLPLRPILHQGSSAPWPRSAPLNQMTSGVRVGRDRPGHNPFSISCGKVALATSVSQLPFAQSFPLSIRWPFRGGSSFLLLCALG